MAAHQILFCPFCRESFEGLAACPEHELPLVPFARLPPASHEHDAEDAPAHDGRLGPFELRYGRGIVALAALINAAALGFPLGGPGDTALAGHSTLALCAGFPVLWTLFLVSFTLAFVLVRRRTRAALASLRFLVPALALASPVALALAGQRLGRGTFELFLGAGKGPGLAVYAVLLASVLMVTGGLRLGGVPGPAHEV